MAGFLTQWWTPREQGQRGSRAPTARRALALAVACGAAVASSSSCTDSTAPITVPLTRVDPQWVTGAAAAALDSITGRITLINPPGTYVARLAADSVALAILHAVRTPSPLDSAQSQLQGDRGGPIDFAGLHLCGAVTYEWTPFGDFPSSVPPFAARALGSQWAVPICGRDESAQISIGVADSPRQFSVVDDTLDVYRSQDLNGAFSLAGVPARYPTGLPLTPERAIEAVFTATAERVATVPVAFDQLSNGLGELPLCASWRMSVERAVTVKDPTAGSAWITSEFFVRHVPACYSDSVAVFAATPNQPTSQWIITGTAGDSVAVQLTGPVVFARVNVVAQ